MAIKIIKNKKNNKRKTKYAVIAVFPDDTFKKWHFDDLQACVTFLNKSHPTWKHFNVYDHATRDYLDQFKLGDYVPKTLLLLFIVLLLGFSNPVSQSTSALALYPWKTTFRKTFAYGIYLCATIPKPKEG